MANSRNSNRRKIQQDALEKVNRIKEIRRRENNGLFPQLLFVMNSQEDVREKGEGEGGVAGCRW